MVPTTTSCRRRLAPVALAIGIAASALACSSDPAPTSSGSATTASTAAPTTSPPTTAGTTSSVPVVPGEVVMKDYELLPAEATVGVGETVTWQNDDEVDHRLLSEDGATIATGDITPGQAATVTFGAPGAYPYYCDIHNAMVGTVVVG